MAKKVQTDENDGDDVEEIFTDLRGNPEPSTLEDDAPPKRKKSQIQADADSLADLGDDDDEDADPLAMDGDDEDGDLADPEDEEEEEAPADEGDEPVIEEPQGEDPRDLRVRQATLALLEERAQRLQEQEGIATGTIERSERAMTAATARIKAAKEAGNTDDEMAALTEWSEARDAIASAKQAITLISTRRSVIKDDLDKIGFDGKTGQLVEREAPRQAAKLTGNAAKFLDTNKKWMSDPKLKTKADLLFQIDRDMGSESKWQGLKAKPEYFEELGRRFNRVAPGLARGLDGKLIATAARTRGTGASAGTGSVGVARDATGKQVRGGKVKFEESDKRAMLKFGLDPGKKTHRANWLREKAAVNTQSSGRA